MNMNPLAQIKFCEFDFFKINIKPESQSFKNFTIINEFNLVTNSERMFF